jgi:hypothetical protein
MDLPSPASKAFAEKLRKFAFVPSPGPARRRPPGSGTTKADRDVSGQASNQDEEAVDEGYDGLRRSKRRRIEPIIPATPTTSTGARSAHGRVTTKRSGIESRSTSSPLSAASSFSSGGESDYVPDNIVQGGDRAESHADELSFDDEPDDIDEKEALGQPSTPTGSRQPPSRSIHNDPATSMSSRFKSQVVERTSMGTASASTSGPRLSSINQTTTLENDELRGTPINIKAEPTFGTEYNEGHIDEPSLVAIDTIPNDSNVKANKRSTVEEKKKKPGKKPRPFAGPETYAHLRPVQDLLMRDLDCESRITLATVHVPFCGVISVYPGNSSSS